MIPGWTAAVIPGSYVYSNNSSVALSMASQEKPRRASAWDSFAFASRGGSASYLRYSFCAASSV